MSDVAMKPTTEVWLSRTWALPLIYHAIDHSRQKHWHVEGEHAAWVNSWWFTVCDRPRVYMNWREGRFEYAAERGTVLPVRALNPELSRPCRLCFAGTA